MDSLSRVFLVVSTIFWFAMLYDCAQNSRDRTWLWIIFILNSPGALLYFVTQRLPHMSFYTKLPGVSHLLTITNRKTKQQLWQAEADARNIGKAHQYAVLGELYLDLRQFDKAETALATALEKEADNKQALWGMAQVQASKEQYQETRQLLETLIQLDPDYMRGDASLAYGQVLYNLEDWPAVSEFLPKDIQRWGHPEAYVMLGELHIKEGRPEEARPLLEGMIARVKGGYDFYYKQHKGSVRKAERILRTLS
ncbi:MAG: tetratricopeptide repeat protein [Cyanobacteria bacterium J06597_1]